MNSLGARNVTAPDIFVPAIFETFGLVHHDLRKNLSHLAESHIYQSVTDTGISCEQKGILKGVIVNEYYQLLSVALMKGIVLNINNAAQRVLQHNGRLKGGGRGSLSTARAQGLIGRAERQANSGLSQLDGG